MPLHLQKLCVGAETVDDLARWIGLRMAERERQGLPREHIHTTRMAPRRTEEILAGGSLYWIIKGVMTVREPIVDLRAITDENGVGRCQIVMSPELVEVEPRQRRAFQGWRYLSDEDAPRDVAAAGLADDLPPEMARELREIGVW